MSVSVVEVQNVNKKIEALMKQKAKSEAQKEVWEAKLNESLADYETEYGIKLTGDNLTAIKNNIVAEYKKVKADTTSQYEQAQKVIALIEQGDIDGAWEAMGIEHKTEVEQAVEEIQAEQGTEEIEEEVNTETFAEEDEVLTGADSIVAEMEDSQEEFESAESVSRSEETPVKSLSFDDDDDFVVQKAEEESVKKSSVLSLDDDDDDFVIPSVPEKKEEKKVLSLDDDEDEESDESSFGGFGSILKGSKFDLGDE